MVHRLRQNMETKLWLTWSGFWMTTRPFDRRTLHLLPKSEKADGNGGLVCAACWSWSWNTNLELQSPWTVFRPLEKCFSSERLADSCTMETNIWMQYGWRWHLVFHLYGWTWGLMHCCHHSAAKWNITLDSSCCCQSLCSHVFIHIDVWNVFIKYLNSNLICDLEFLIQEICPTYFIVLVIFKLNMLSEWHLNVVH